MNPYPQQPQPQYVALKPPPPPGSWKPWVGAAAVCLGLSNLAIFIAPALGFLALIGYPALAWGCVLAKKEGQARRAARLGAPLGTPVPPDLSGVPAAARPRTWVGIAVGMTVLGGLIGAMMGMRAATRVDGGASMAGTVTMLSVVLGLVALAAGMWAVRQHLVINECVTVTPRAPRPAPMQVPVAPVQPQQPPAMTYPPMGVQQPQQPPAAPTTEPVSEPVDTWLDDLTDAPADPQPQAQRRDSFGAGIDGLEFGD